MLSYTWRFQILLFFALGYVPMSSCALGAAYVSIFLSEVEQEQRPSGNGDRETIVMGAGAQSASGLG